MNNKKFINEHDMLVAYKKRKLRETNPLNKIPNSLGSFLNDCEYFSDEDSFIDNYSDE